MVLEPQVFVLLIFALFIGALFAQFWYYEFYVDWDYEYTQKKLHRWAGNDLWDTESGFLAWNEEEGRFFIYK